jgi:hypothetical protein
MKSRTRTDHPKLSEKTSFSATIIVITSMLDLLADTRLPFDSDSTRIAAVKLLKDAAERLKNHPVAEEIPEKAPETLKGKTIGKVFYPDAFRSDMPKGKPVQPC